MKDLYGEVGEISSDFQLIQTIGGKKFVHARGCPIITDWDVNGCRELREYKPKLNVCPTCKKYIWITIGASDYAERWKQYKSLFEKASERIVYTLFVEKKATCFWHGNRLFIHCKDDEWYLDYSYEEIRLYHNNYNIKERNKTGENIGGGYHEHELDNELKSAKLNNALRQIVKYDFEEADKVHRKKRVESLGRRTFSEFDPEYYGFNC